MNSKYAPLLLDAAKVVAERFKAGYHPTEEQLQRLDAAINACEVLLVCGHDLDDDCPCADLSPAGMEATFGRAVGHGTRKPTKQRVRSGS